MYTRWMYVSLAFLICLIPFSIPIRIKSGKLRRIRNLVLTGFVISSLIALTPDKAVEGAPFNFFGDGKITYFSCTYQIYLTKAQFCELGSAESSTCECSNENARATMAACFHFLSKNDKQDYISMCAKQHNVFLSDDDFTKSLLHYEQNARPLSEVENFTDGSLIDFPVMLDQSKSHLFKDAYEQFLGNYDHSVIYGGYLIFYWVVIFVAFSIINWSKLFFPSIHKALVNPFSSWFRKTISTPATGGRKKTNEQRFLRLFDFLVPTRLETIILSTFLALTIYFTFKGIHYVDGDPVFKSRTNALLRYFAVRTSILASCCMPLLILFGGRNNFLQGFTRWDYSTYIAFHRWLSRIVVILVVAHSKLYALYDNNWKKLYSHPYIKWGLLGTVSGIIILVQGMLVLRRNHYELFLLLHIALAFGFILGAYVHVLDLYCLWFYHYCFAIWLFDRLVRIGRLYSFGFPKAKIYLLADEALKVVIPKPENFDVISGGHVFIHFLRPSCFWQSHPFTYTKSPNNDNEIIIFMKVKKGVTQHIYNYLLAHPNKVAEIRVAVEGSYGEETPTQAYDSGVFLAGGNGIPGIYAEALHLATTRFNKTRVKLIWVVREYRSLFWFYEELLALRDINVEVDLYITRPTSYEALQEFSLRFPSERNEIVPVSSISETTSLKDSISSRSYGSIDESEAKDLISKIKQELSFVTFREGRPNIDQIVKDTIKESTGSSAYITCGHPVMVDDLRAAVVNNIDNPQHKRIDYFEQLQVWA